MSSQLLRVRDLQVSFPAGNDAVRAVRGVDLTMARGEALGLVGESGCGKSLTALSLLGLVPAPGQTAAAELSLLGQPLASLDPRQLRAVRGRQVGMIFQEPMTSLNPVFSVGYQLGEALTAHQKLGRAELRRRCLELLQEVGVPAAEQRLRAYPAQLSGGLRQRVMIATAIACGPQLLVADEPTTALDVTIQAQIMSLLARLRRERAMGLLLITHDLGLVAQNVDRVLVMYAGYVVEEAETRALFAHPLHPYTRGLMASVPGAGARARSAPLHTIAGSVPHPSRVPGGCPFRDRCSLAEAACAEEVPPLLEKESRHRVRCIKVPVCSN